MVTAFRPSRIIADSVALSQQLNAVAPNVTQLLYTNVSTIYQSLLTDWLTYADRNGVSREAAFYHVKAATPFTGNSPSSQPVKWFWSVLRGNTSFFDLTFQAHGATTPFNVTATGAGRVRPPRGRFTSQSPKMMTTPQPSVSGVTCSPSAIMAISAVIGGRR